MAQPRGNMPYNLAQAGAAVGRNRSTILKAIRRGVLSAGRDEATGGWAIEPAELHRVFPPVAAETSGNAQATAETGELRELRARLADAQDQISDLRRRLDASDEERRRLTLTLADQRPARRWWCWR